MITPKDEDPTEEVIETLSDVDETEQMDDKQLVDHFESILEVYEHCLQNLNKMMEHIGKTKEDSLIIRKDIKHEKDFALSLSKDLHNLTFANNSYLTEHHPLSVAKYKKLMAELNQIFKRLNELESQYPQTNLPESTNGSYITPVYKKLSNYIFRKDEFEEELLQQHGAKDSGEMTEVQLDELQNDLKEIVSVFEKLDVSAHQSTLNNSMQQSQTKTCDKQQGGSGTNPNVTSCSNASPEPSLKEQRAYGTAAVVTAGMLVGSVVGGPIGMLVGAKIGASLLTTVSVGTGLGLVGGGILAAARGFTMFRQGTSSVNHSDSGDTNHHQQDPNNNTTTPHQEPSKKSKKEDDDSRDEEEKKDK